MYYGRSKIRSISPLIRINKDLIIEQILTGLTEKFETLSQAARATYDGAIHDESKAEDKYDTRGLEASYLAGAQAERASEIEAAISIYSNLKARDFSLDDPVALTALVEVEVDGKEALYFVGPEGGGTKLRMEGRDIIVITPKAPLGKRLIGKVVHDEFNFSAGWNLRYYTILSIA